MLRNCEVTAAIAAKDLDRAKKFYEEKLGFTPKTEDPGGVLYEAGSGSHLFLFPTPHAGTAKNTVASFTTDDLEAEMAELRERGVVFEEYDELKTVNGVATMDGHKAAWFKDSEGNILALDQK